MKKYKVYGLLTRGKLDKNDCISPFVTSLPFLADFLKRQKLAYKDSVIPTYKYIFNQPTIFDKILLLQQTISSLSSSDLQDKSIIAEMIESADNESNLRWYVGLSWILVDLASYFMMGSGNLQLSKSYGLVLNIWVIMEIVAGAVRMGVNLHWLAGAITAVVLLSLHWVAVYFIEKKVLKTRHKYSYFDTSCTNFVKNMLALLIFANLCLHIINPSIFSLQTLASEGLSILKRLGDGTSPFLTLIWSFSEV